LNQEKKTINEDLFEDSETVINCHGLKMDTADDKIRLRRQSHGYNTKNKPTSQQSSDL
jgi:hypothetical protein